MLIVKTELKQKKDGTIGVFAAQNISFDQRVIKAEHVIDRWFYHQQIINDNLLEFFQRYGVYSDEKGSWHLYGDNARFIAHSVHNTVVQNGLHCYAAAKINKGEELTFNYLIHCDWVKTHGLKFRMPHRKDYFRNPAYAQH